MWSQLLGIARCLERACARKSFVRRFSCRCSLRRRRVGPPGARIGGRILLLLPTFADKRRRHGKCGAEAERAWHSASEVLKARGPTTGFYRDGCCTTGDSDYGRHVVCSRMTQVSGPTQPRPGVGSVPEDLGGDGSCRLSIPRSTRDLPAIPPTDPDSLLLSSSTCPCCRAP